jgi:hypothetical protein
MMLQNSQQIGEVSSLFESKVSNFLEFLDSTGLEGTPAAPIHLV